MADTLRRAAAAIKLLQGEGEQRQVVPNAFLRIIEQRLRQIWVDLKFAVRLDGRLAGHSITV